MFKAKSEAFEWIKAIVIALILAVLIRTFLFAPIIVKGESMYPTLHNGEQMIVNKIGYAFSEPKRFDIVVFHANEEQDYIKRVIGLPGDHIEYIDDTLYINGVPYEEEYLEPLKKGLDTKLTYDFSLEEITKEKTIPEGYIFVMGDNRQYSLDSRDLGPISIDQVVGKANIVYWPFSNIRIAK